MTTTQTEREVTEQWPLLLEDTPEDKPVRPIVAHSNKLKATGPISIKDPFVPKVTPKYNDWHHTEPVFPLWAWGVWIFVGYLIYHVLIGQQQY